MIWLILLKIMRLNKLRKKPDYSVYPIAKIWKSEDNRIAAVLITKGTLYGCKWFFDFTVEECSRCGVDSVHSRYYNIVPSNHM